MEIRRVLRGEDKEKILPPVLPGNGTAQQLFSGNRWQRMLSGLGTGELFACLRVCRLFVAVFILVLEAAILGGQNAVKLFDQSCKFFVILFHRDL